MVNQYAFFVDSDACSGCKTCQVACKDANGLAAGVLWRKVIEVAGGGWTRKNGLWISTVAAYNLSSACVHCLEPVWRAGLPDPVHLETGRRHRPYRPQPLHGLPDLHRRLPVRGHRLRRRGPRRFQMPLLRGPGPCGPGPGLRGGLPQPGPGFRRPGRIEGQVRRG